ncbi:MAG: tetratricopeptide repeat protein [Candidatus Latescibacteria bacterium]|nr:tetratricopeptide repeat protein [Candidatus Latescibacterota bacterium]
MKDIKQEAFKTGTESLSEQKSGDKFVHFDESARQEVASGIRNIGSAVIDNDKELLHYAQVYLEKKITDNEMSQGEWHCPLFYRDNVLIRFEGYEYFNLSPLQKYLEILRAEAEAWLIHNKMDYCELSDWEKENYMKRALGILPDNTDEQFCEILASPFFQRQPSDIKKLMAEIEWIEKEYGQHTALAFAILQHNGVSKKSEFEYYGQKLDMLFAKILSFPQMQTVWQNNKIERSFDTEYILLATLRDRILKHLPERVEDNRRVLLIDFLEDYSQLENNPDKTNKIGASELLFACLDSIILSRFDLENSCVVSNDTILLEIVPQERLIYWNPLSNAPIAYAKPTINYRNDYRFLIAKTIAKIADVYLQLSRDSHKAIQHYQNAISVIPDYPETYASLAQIYIKLKDARRAVETLSKAIEINPDSAEYYHMQGLAYCLSSNFAQAIKELKKAITLQPNYIEALNNLGVCYEQTGETNKALETYNQIINIEPNYFQANFGLGNVYFTLKKYERALIYFERATKLDPQSSNCLYNLAQTYYELGEVNNSIKTYKQLLQINPNHAASWYNLGIIYRNKGMKKEAVKCIEQAVRLNPNLMK